MFDQHPDNLHLPPTITEEPETLEEANERLRFESLSPEQQHLLFLHVLDQFDAVPSYCEQQARRFAHE